MPSPNSKLRLVASRIGQKQGGLSLTDPDVQAGLREFWALGWRKDLERMEVAPPHIRKMTGKEIITPWYVSPEGLSFRGLRAAVLHASASLPPEEPEQPPSPLALRVIEALRRDPVLLAEVKTLLDGAKE